MTAVKVNEFNFQDWNFVVKKSRILSSKCYSPEKCKSLSVKEDNVKFCKFCRFENELKLPQLPEMTFPDNSLCVMHKTEKFGIEFTCLDALKLVNDSQDLLKVAVSDAWKESRKEFNHIHDVIKPFDWTYTTSYQGSLIANGENHIIEKDTEMRIDYDKLKKREKILFYDETHLFEDELADNGCAVTTARIRVMESGFFMLFRFFLRVDDLLVRINDTRIHHEAGNKYLLKEYTSRESLISNVQGAAAKLLSEPDGLCQHLPVVTESFKKLEFL